MPHDPPPPRDPTHGYEAPTVGKLNVNWRNLPPALTHALAALLTAILAVGVTVVVNDNGPDHPAGTPQHTVTVKLGGTTAKVPGSPSTTTIALTPKAQAIATAQKAATAAGDPTVESHLNAPAPSAQAVQQSQPLKPPGQPAIPANVPLAAASQPGCTTAFVRNYSSRRGAPVELGFIHWTGSPITSGPDGGLAIVRWFDTLAAQASSNYITDQAGRCWYVVPETQKAWTQAAANPWALSVEIVNPGVLPLFRSTAGREAVVRLMIGWHHRWGIPYQHGAVNSSCVPTRAGFLAHRDGGPCAGGHPDVGLPSAVDGLIAEAKAQDSPKPKCTRYDECFWRLSALDSVARTNAKTLLLERRIAHRHGGWGKVKPLHNARAKAAKTALVQRRAALPHGSRGYHVLGRLITAR